MIIKKLTLIFSNGDKCKIESKYISSLFIKSLSQSIIMESDVSDGALSLYSTTGFELSLSPEANQNGLFDMIQNNNIVAVKFKYNNIKYYVDVPFKYDTKQTKKAKRNSFQRCTLINGELNISIVK